MLNVIRIIVLIGYLLINFYLMAFNWQVYTVSICRTHCHDYLYHRSGSHYT